MIKKKKGWDSIRRLTYWPGTKRNPLESIRNHCRIEKDLRLPRFIMLVKCKDIDTATRQKIDSAESTNIIKKTLDKAPFIWYT